ncbi:hypothetical protein D3C80_1847840 [compost metagenome]
MRGCPATCSVIFGKTLSMTRSRARSNNCRRNLSALASGAVSSNSCASRREYQTSSGFIFEKRRK